MVRVNKTIPARATVRAGTFETITMKEVAIRRLDVAINHLHAGEYAIGQAGLGPSSCLRGTTSAKAKKH